MVLYYKKIEKPPPEEAPPLKKESIVEDKHYVYNYPKYKDFEEMDKTRFSNRGELYYSLLEDNFNSLSTDDKIIVLYKTFILKNNTTNNYILMCLAMLVIIALKLYSK